MNKEEKEINDLYEQLLDEYKDYKEEMTTVSKARKTFAMDVHEQMKQEQIEKILEQLGDVVTKLNANDDLSKDKTKLHERFYDLLTEFKEINESSYGGSKKNGKTKRTVRKKNDKKTNDKKTKRTVRKTKNKRKTAKKTT